MTILLYLLFIIYPIAFGIVNALIYGRRGADSFKMDEHLFILFEIIAVYASIEAVNEFRNLFSVWDVRLAIICCLASHPFFKDGSYFLTRHYIDGAYYGWTDDSTTSTALINFKWPLRLGFFILSLLTIGIYELYY